VAIFVIGAIFVVRR